jgi:hypothetical protein
LSCLHLEEANRDSEGHRGQPVPKDNRESVLETPGLPPNPGLFGKERSSGGLGVGKGNHSEFALAQAQKYWPLRTCGSCDVGVHGLKEGCVPV